MGQTISIRESLVATPQFPNEFFLIRVLVKFARVF